MKSNGEEHRPESADVLRSIDAFPRMCVLSSVYVCNSRCPHCPYTGSGIRERYRDTPYMAPATFKLIADQCGVRRAWLRISGGGEPLLHPQMPELVEYAKSVGCRVGLITNGSLLNERMGERLLECGVDAIEVSVDAGDAASYARVRPGLDWQRLVDNLVRLNRLRSRNAAGTRIICSVVVQEGIDVEAAEAFWSPMVDQFQKRKFLTWGIVTDRSGDRVPYLPPEQAIPCPFPFERLFVDARGDVKLCGFDIHSSTNLGNVNRQPIAEIWQGDGFGRVRRLHAAGLGREIELCNGCSDWQYRSWRHNYWKLVGEADGRRGSNGPPHRED